ncbi:MAG: hypothetical protein ACC707_12530 [Thiohalomonadales bacterium]
MIRGTKNESISSLSKQRHTTGALNYTGTKSQLYETIQDTAGIVLERRDEFDIHSVVESEFPSNAFNGTFE